MEVNIEKNVIGVYLITNINNKKQYVGSSNDVRHRIMQHFRTSCYNKYQSNQFYIDIKKYGKNAFECELLEETTKANKLEREQYWYDKLDPQYNFIRPVRCSFDNPKVQEKSSRLANDEKHIKARKELYNTETYKKHFRTMNPSMKPVEMYKDGKLVKVFASIRSAARWLDNNTNFKGKSKATKIKEVCDQKRSSTYGYTFKYSNKSVETILNRSKDPIDTDFEAVN